MKNLKYMIFLLPVLFFYNCMDSIDAEKAIIGIWKADDKNILEFTSNGQLKSLINGIPAFANYNFVKKDTIKAEDSSGISKIYKVKFKNENILIMKEINKENNTSEVFYIKLSIDMENN